MNSVNEALNKAKGSAEEVTNTVNQINDTVNKVNQTTNELLATKDEYNSKALDFIGIDGWSMESLKTAVEVNPVDTLGALALIIGAFLVFFYIMSFVRKVITRIILLGLLVGVVLYLFM